MLSASAVAGPSGDLRGLIAAKEAELREINEYRIAALEALAAEKEKEATSLRAKLSRVTEDFVANLELFKERDSELAQFETLVAELNGHIKVRDSQIESLQQQLAESKRRADADSARVSDLEAFYAQQMDGLRGTIEAARTAREEETRRLLGQVEAAHRDADARMRERDAEHEQQRRAVTEAADAALAAVKREALNREEEAAAAVKMADERASAAQRNAEAHNREAESLSAQLAKAHADCATTKEELSAARLQLSSQIDELKERMRAMQLEAERAQLGLQAKIEVLTRERDSAQSARAAAISEHETRILELTTSLRAVEATMNEQRQQYESRLAEQQGNSAAAAEELAAQLERHMEGIAGKLAEAERDKSRLLEELQGVKSSLAIVNAHAEQVEGMLRDAQQELAASSSRGTEQAEAAAAARQAAQRLEAELVAVRAHLTDSQDELKRVKDSWEQRWAARESSISKLTEAAARLPVLEEQLAAMRDDRDRLAAVISGSPPPAVSAVRALEDSTTSMDPRVADAAAASARSILTQLNSLERELAASRAEIGSLSDELVHARMEAGQKQVQVTKLSAEKGQMEAQLAHLRRELDSHHRMPLSSPGGFSGDEGMASPPTGHMLALAETQQENGMLRQRCQELEVQCSQLRIVIADMRAHMEREAEQLATATARGQHADVAASAAADNKAAAALADAEAYKCSAEVLLSALASDRDMLAAEVTRCQEYIKLLQQSHEAAASSAADGAVSAELRSECHMLRQHAAQLQESLSQLRSLHRVATQELARVKGQLAWVSAQPQAAGHNAANMTALTSTRDAHAHVIEGAASSSTGRGSLADEESAQALKAKLQASKAEVERLLGDRERLLDLSNQLKAQLKRASAAGQRSATEHVAAPAAAPVTAPVDNQHIAHLEHALHRMAVQNAQLHSDLQLLLAQATAPNRSRSHRPANSSAAASLAIEPPAASTTVAAEEAEEFGADNVSAAHFQPQSPGRVRLDAARQRLGLPVTAASAADAAASGRSAGGAANPWAATAPAPADVRRPSSSANSTAGADASRTDGRLRAAAAPTSSKLPQPAAPKPAAAVAPAAAAPPPAPNASMTVQGSAASVAHSKARMMGRGDVRDYVSMSKR